MEADLDRDGRISFDEFKKMVENTDVSMSMTLGPSAPVPLYYVYSKVTNKGPKINSNPIYAQ